MHHTKVEVRLFIWIWFFEDIDKVITYFTQLEKLLYFRICHNVLLW